MKLFSGYIQLYSSVFGRRLHPPTGSGFQTISYWQSRFFANLMLIITPFGLIAYIPSQIMSLRDGLFFLASFNTLALGSLFIIHFSSKLSLHTRKVLLLANLYLLGIVLLYYLGWSGPGLAYLLGCSTLSVLIVGSKIGYLSLGSNVLVFSVFAVMSGLGYNNNRLLSGLELGAIITIGINFILINSVLIVAIASLIQVLQKKLLTELRTQERLRIEMKMHQNAKVRAEESDRLKSAFLANMSHEIRTPLNSIIGFTQYLQNPNIARDKQLKFLRIVETSGNRLLYMINDLIDISKIESGQMPIVTSSMDVNEQMKSIHSQFEPEARAKGLTLQLASTLNQQNTIILTDREKFYSIMTNLVKNAIKYTERGRIDFGFNILGGTIKFYVTDSGIGISANQLQSIFERFVQTEDAIASPYEGAGLGLAIAKAYVEMLGGKIWVESDKGLGAKFYFTLPYIKG